MALGFTLIFGILRLVNFAHGEFYMIGAFVTYYLISKFAVNYFFAIALSTVVVGIIGFAIEKALFAPLRGRELSMLMSALGLQITIQGLMAVWVGVDSYSITPPFTGILEFDFLSFPVERIFVIALTIFVLFLFYLLIKFTMIGKALRAVALDDEAALMQGIPVNRVYTLAFGLGCSLAAIAGALIGPVFSLHVYMGQSALLKAFIVVILGGLGSIPGAVLGGLILGLGESAFATLLGGLTAEMFGFGLIIFILLLRPSGLLGRPQL
jgi:branched-chain amino acid transport system permease protein